MRTLPVLSPLHALTFFPHRQGMQRAILCVVTSSWLRHIARPPPADQPDRRPHQPLRPARVRSRPPADPPRAPGCPLRPRLPLIPSAGHGMRSPQREQDRHVVRRVQRRLLPLEPRRCHRHEEDQLHPLPRPRRTRVAARGSYPPLAHRTCRPTRDAENPSPLNSGVARWSCIRSSRPMRRTPTGQTSRMPSRRRPFPSVFKCMPRDKTCPRPDLPRSPLPARIQPDGLLRGPARSLVPLCRGSRRRGRQGKGRSRRARQHQRLVPQARRGGRGLRGQRRLPGQE